jgi:BASS family bile acid:Na+ symporter
MPKLLATFESIIVRYFSFILMTGLGVGLLFPGLCEALAPFVLYLLMLVIYLGFLKTDYTILKREIRNGKCQLWLSTFSLILLPSLLFLVVKGLERSLGTNPAWGIGVLLLFASPGAAIGPTLAYILRGRFERTLCSLILTSMVAPFTLPLMLSFWVGETIEVDLQRMTLFLIQLILLPFIAAQVTRRYAKPLERSLKPHTASLSVFLLFLVILGAIEGLSEKITSNPQKVVEGIWVASACIFLAYVIGWCLHPPKASLADRSTLAIISSWSNIGLAIVFAKQFFPNSDVLLFVILAEIPWNCSFAPAQMFVRKMDPGGAASVP